MVEKSLVAFPNVLKDTSKVCEQMAIKLRESKVNLDRIKKNQMIERENLRRLMVKKLRSERHLCCLEELILMLKNEISELDKQKTELLQKISSVTWSQNKADLIIASERKAHDGKEALSRSFIAENELQDSLTTKSFINHAKEEEEEKSKKRNEKKTILEEELKDTISKTATTTNEIFTVEQENRVLQKRNSALLLRLQKQLKETEMRRNQVVASLEKTKHENKKASRNNYPFPS